MEVVPLVIGMGRPQGEIQGPFQWPDQTRCEVRVHLGPGEENFSLSRFVLCLLFAL